MTDSEDDAQERFEDLLDAALEGREQLTPDDLEALGEFAKDLADEEAEERD